MDIIKKLIPHVCVVFAGMFIVFFAIDKFNGAMSVLGSNEMSKTLLLIFSLLALVVSGMLIYKQRREN